MRFSPPKTGMFFLFTSAENQFVTVVVVPVSAQSDFDLALLDEHGKPVLSSSLITLVDWIQIKVSAGTRLRAKVTIKSALLPFAPGAGDYRLFVTGSTQYLNKSNISGPQVIPLPRRP